MKSVLCTQSWHSFDDRHCHLLLMMDFDCPLAFRHKKREYIFRSTVFLFQGVNLFVGWRLWSLDCISVLHIVFYFLALATFFLFCWAIHVRERYFFALYVSCFNCLLIYIYEFFIDICLYCVLFEIKNLFYLLVFSTHAVMHFV